MSVEISGIASTAIYADQQLVVTYPTGESVVFEQRTAVASKKAQ
jgi:hypothetical protein